MEKFRALKPNEVSVRVGQKTKNGDYTFLLYKNARTDADILDETVGPLNWQKQYTRENANCIVSIWDDGKKQWVSKEDVGKESNAEGAKGLASDSFKRACVAWGIGRELYTAPFIFVRGEKFECDAKGNIKGEVYVKNLEVSEDKKITSLVIYYKNKGTDVCVYSFGSNEKVAPTSNSKTTAPAKPTNATTKSTTAKSKPEVSVPTTTLTKQDCDPAVVKFAAGIHKGKTIAEAAKLEKGISTIKYCAVQEIGDKDDKNEVILACQRYLEENPETA